MYRLDYGELEAIASAIASLQAGKDGHLTSYEFSQEYGDKPARLTLDVGLYEPGPDDKCGEMITQRIEVLFWQPGRFDLKGNRGP